MQEQVPIWQLGSLWARSGLIGAFSVPEEHRHSGLAVELGQAQLLDVRPERDRLPVTDPHLERAVPADVPQDLLAERVASGIVTADQR